jgi:eukaryotic-like serine/threonine-protein kinase
VGLYRLSDGTMGFRLQGRAMTIQTTDPGNRVFKDGEALVLPLLLGGRYELVEEIARGGMATVYRAMDLLLDREVAVKVLDRSLSRNPSFVSRFKREARAAARLNHPNIVSHYDYGCERDIYFIVMELVPGRSLSRLGAAGDRLTTQRAAEIALDVAQALECAHGGGVIHRDITANNVMISGTRTKVADFGIAHLAAGNDDRTTAKNGVIVGTAAYLSPEQARGGRVDERSDVYSLGIVLYEMLTGRVPFQADSPLATAHMHLLQPVPPPSLLNPEIPAGLETIVMSALAKDADDRYQNASEIALDLRRYLDGRPVPTLEIVESAKERPWLQLVRDVPQPRRPRRKLGYVLAPLLAIIGLITGWWLSANWDMRNAPKVTGLVESNALDRARDHELETRIIRSHGIKPSGVVTAQTPSAGTELREGDTMIIEVSLGPEPTFSEHIESAFRSFELPVVLGPIDQLWPFSKSG